MTIGVEELLVLLFVAGAGKPLVTEMKHRMLKAITASEQRHVTNRDRELRFRARIIDIWIE